MLTLLYQTLYLAIGIFAICFVIAIHEFGHFLTAKFFNVKVPVFSIGMGNQLLHKKIGNTDFKLSAIPLGGYVEILENAEMAQEAGYDASIPGVFFGELAYWKKLIVLLAGITFNLLLGIVIFIGLAFTGMPKTTMVNPDYQQPTIVGTVMAGSAAAQAGFLDNDRILSCDQTACKTTQDLSTYLQAHKNQTIQITLMRNQQSVTLPITVGSDGKIGILWAMEFEQPQGLLSGLSRGLSAARSCIQQSFRGMISLLSGKSKGSVAGPIMIIAQIMHGARMGLRVVFLLSAFISVGLAFLNLIPIPIFDGGQVVIISIEALIRRKLPKKVHLAIAYTTWALVLGLFIFISLKDILSLSGTSIHNIGRFIKNLF
jgi:regulator of sigma E protease